MAMSLPRLCLETFIPSHLVVRPSRDIELAGQQEVTRRWRNDCPDNCELCVLPFVESETSQGDTEMVAAQLAKPDGVLRRLGEHLRAGEARRAAAGHPLASFAGQPPLELPPVDWEKIDAEPENEIITGIRATRRKLKAEREAENVKPDRALAARRRRRSRRSENKKALPAKAL